MPALAPAPDRVSPSPATPPAGPGARRVARERTARRGRILGAVVTVGAHLLLFLVLRSAAVEPDFGARPAQATPEPPAGMRVVHVTEPIS
ncbi:MAG TPA: hypothetical protein VMK65_10105, partial [Longimicrobiales bacterium]|nr:hypothetical protein [Longimicrobiales bacterium]